MPLSIEQVVAWIPAWTGRAVTTAPLSGGLTNAIYRVDVDGASFVVRIPGADSDLLAVDRVNEYHNTRAAAEAGVCPAVAHFLTDANVMVLDFVRGETQTVASLRRPGQPGRVAAVLRQLHAGPRFLHDFNMFRLTEHYLRTVERRNLRIPAKAVGAAKPARIRCSAGVGDCEKANRRSASVRTGLIASP